MSDNFDNDLRDVLRRTEPPAGFAERVLARATHPAAAPSPVGTTPLRQWTWAAAALAACLTLTVGLVEYRHQAEQQARGLEAKQELMQAMRITGSKLRVAQEKVRHLNE